MSQQQWIGIAIAMLLAAYPSGLVNAVDPGLDKVIIEQGYTVGIGGGMKIKFRSYLLFKDGTILRNPHEAPADLDVSRSRAQRSQDWGRYQTEGDKIQVWWSDGKSESISQWWVGRPAKSGSRLSGLYQLTSVSGGGGGTTMVVSSDAFQFNADGSFSNKSLVGGSSRSPLSPFGKSQEQERGSYRLDGYTIELKTTDGRIQRVLFFYLSDSEDAVGIGSQMFVKEK